MRQSPPVRFARIVALSSAALLPACGDGTGPPGPPSLPALEQTSHAQLGNVRIAFERLGRLGDASGVYWLNGGSGNWGGFVAGLAVDPSLSPDGLRLAFRAATDFATSWDVYVSDLAGGERQQLSSEHGNTEGAPTWTTDAAVVWGLWDQPVRFVRHATGNAQPETIGSFVQPTSQPCPTHATFDGPPSVSPSGELLFVCQRMALYRMAPNGQPVLLHTPAAAADALRHAAWSPGGDRIAFLSHRTARNSSEPGFVRIHMLDAAGGTPTLVAERVIPAGSDELGNAPKLTLCWAGDRIVFAAPTGHFTAHIFVVPATGGTPVQVTSAPGVSDGSVSCSSAAF